MNDESQIVHSSFRLLVIASCLVMIGCSGISKNEPCFTYSDCPGYVYALGPKFAAPNSSAEHSEDGEPQLLETSIPVYPESAWRNKIEGFAEFEFDVNPAGKPINIRVIESQPGLTFAGAGSQAIKLSRYTKTVSGGTGFQKRMTWTIDRKPSTPSSDPAVNE